MMFAPMLAKEKSRFARAKRLPVVVGRDLPWWLCRVVILFTLITFYGDSDGFDCQSAAFFGAPVVTLGCSRGSVPKLVLDGRDVLPCFEEQAGQGAPEVVPGGALGKGGLFEALVQDLARGFVGDGTAGDDLAVFENLAEDGTGVRAAQIDPLVEGGQGAVEQEDQALLVSLAVPDQEVGAVVCVGEVVDHDVSDLFVAGASLDCQGDQGRVTGAGRGGVVGASMDQGGQVFFREVAAGREAFAAGDVLILEFDHALGLPRYLFGLFAGELLIGQIHNATRPPADRSQGLLEGGGGEGAGVQEGEEILTQS